MNKSLCRIAAIVSATALILSAFPLISFVFAQAVTVSTADEFINAVNDENNSIDIAADFELTQCVSSPFAGTINGNGHVITVNSDAALFNELSKGSTVKNLGVVAKSPINVSNGNRYGVFADTIDGKVENCFAYGVINGTANAGEDCYVGGFCGEVKTNAVISNSFSCVSMDIVNVDFAGGFAGIIRPNGDGTSVASVTLCYSSGYIKDSTDTASKTGARRYVAGFANVDEAGSASISNTYTSCQLVNISNDAKPSGVNGLYDNQLSLMLESSNNKGLSTKELMTTDKLPADDFAITSSAYPSLKTFYATSAFTWSKQALDIVALSVTAAAFTDADTTTYPRYEPDGMQARADYLTWDTYIDRTNYNSTEWSIDSKYCTVYDTVPLTTYGSSDLQSSAGNSADLLRSRYSFSQDDSAVLKASLSGYTKQWFLTVSSKNPFYAQQANGSSSTPFEINSKAEMEYVRHYTLRSSAHYSLKSNIDIDEFDPIVDFQGTFLGNNNTLCNVTLADDRDGAMGIFANTLNGSMIKELVLSSVTASTKHNNKHVGSLIGTAVGTTVSSVVVQGSYNTVSSINGIAGGVIGHATDCSLTKMLISCETDGTTAGGLVGSMVGGTLSLSGSTGLVGGYGTTLGGLIGSAKNVDSVSDCYSTAMVLTNIDSQSVAGLIGNTDGTTNVTSCFSAALAASKNESDAFVRRSPLIAGTEVILTDCSYDGQFYGEDSSSISVSGENWTVLEGHYPQLTCFKDTALSPVSTDMFIYQQYWKDAVSDDATTAFIPQKYNEPVAADAFCDESAMKIYSVENTAGFGFEPASGTSFAAVKTTDKNHVGVRYAVTIRDDLIPIKFETTDSSADSVYLSVAYRESDSDEWTETHFRLTENSAIYDIPKESYIRLAVLNDYSRSASSVTISISDTELEVISSTTTDGYFVSTKTYSEAITVSIHFEENVDRWGVQRDTL